MMGLRPLTDQEAEAAFIALCQGIERGNGCLGASLVRTKDDTGMTIMMHYSAERCRRLIKGEANEPG